MSVISINITESTEQLIAGIPRSISASTNIPATIFYTVDGSTPTDMSSVYTNIILLPNDVSDYVIKLFATNGTDISAIITNEYSTNILHDTRLPHAAVTGLDNSSGQSMYPFGSNTSLSEFDYLNSGDAGITVSNSSLPVIPYGYDAYGNVVGTTNPSVDYLNVYSVDNKTRANIGIGPVPGIVTIAGRRTILDYTPEESDRANKLFNAKAMVIIQDTTTEDPGRPPQINPQFFSLENLELARDGSVLRAHGLESPVTTGSYIRSEYNPRTQMVTDYYHDSATNKWIMSSYPYQPKQADPGNLSNMVFPRNSQGVGRVYNANFGRYSTLT